MIKLTNIQKNNNIISVNVVSNESYPHQSYKLIFDIVSEKYSASINEPDKFDVFKIIHKLSSYTKDGKKLPEIDCIACF